MQANDRRIACSVFVGAVLLLLQLNPLSACDGTIRTASAIDGEYDPFHPIENNNDYSVDIENTGDAECTFSLFLRGVAPNAKLGGALEFSFAGSRLNQAIAGDAPLPTQMDRFLGSYRLRAGESGNVAYRLVLPPGQMVAAGIYEHSPELVLRATAEAISSIVVTPPADIKPLRIRYRVMDQMSINIAGAGKQKTIDFGELAEGAVKDVRIWARSNQKFFLDAHSMNGGAMALPAPFSQSRVEYRMAVNGKTVSFPANLGPFEETGRKREYFDLTFTIGDIAGKRAGLYADEITIEINAAP